MIDQLLNALVGSKNEAADDLLLDGLRRGVEMEKAVVIGALMARKSTRGLSGVIQEFPRLPEPLQAYVLSNIRVFYHALRECGRSDDVDYRLAAMRLIAMGHQGKLAYVLAENLNNTSDEKISKTACEGLVALSRWVASETRALQKGAGSAAAEPIEATTADARGARGGAGAGREAAGTEFAGGIHGSEIDAEENADRPFRDMPSPDKAAPAAPPATRRGIDVPTVYKELLSQRHEIEIVIARALEAYRGPHAADILRAGLLLLDSPVSKMLAVLQSGRHNGQTAMVRRLQQPPASESTDAFLLGASHGHLRSHFGAVFTNINEPPVLDALLRRTHWLKDNKLQLCMHQVSRGVWWSESELNHDLNRRDPANAVRIAEWIGASGLPDQAQDDRLEQIRVRAKDDVAARVRILRVAAGRKRGASIRLLRTFLDDPDERIARIAAREIVRRRTKDYENILLQQMTNAGASVRKVIGRAIGRVGFEHFWTRFDKLDKPTRKQAGRAMLKLLPDGVHRLNWKLTSGTVEQRLKAMQIATELELCDAVKDTLVLLTSHAHGRVRSKAISLLRNIVGMPPDVVLERVLHDTDARVRANAIEVLESNHRQQYVPLLAEKARASSNRERANAIKALHHMRVGTAGQALAGMLQDQRSEHKISALWVLKQVGFWKLLGDVGRLAKSDADPRVRKYAVGLLKGVAELAQSQKKKAS